jgi:PiT family inorganic phosphate transporter
MGLIMLILIGAAPTAYALNRTMPDTAMPAFIAAAHKAEAVFDAHAGPTAPMTPQAARSRIGDGLKSKVINDPEVYAALGVVSREIETELQSFKSIRQVPAAATSNMRTDMYLTGDALRVLNKSDKVKLPPAETKVLKTFQGDLQTSTRFIPTWVKISVAIALGLGTMIGWKRIVVTVGERIGKEHLTYAQGASAELVAAATISLADMYGLPVSTTHVLSSGVAGTMAANGSGLQWSTIRSIASAWVLTLPAAIILSGSLYYIFRHMV